MPFYDFQCRECSAVTEVKASISQKERGLSILCPECQSANMVQVFRQVAVIGARTDSASKPWTPPAGGACGANCGCHPQD